MNTKACAIFILMIFGSTSYAQSLNLYLTDSDTYTMGSAQPALSNNRLFFSGNADGQAAVWSLNTDNSEKEVLFIGAAYPNNNSVSFHKLDSSIYFMGYNYEDLTITLWKTDGTAAGTSQVFDTLFSSGLYENNGFLFATNSDGKLVVTDGFDAVTHEVGIWNFDSTCLFDINNVMVQINTENDKPFIQSNNGSVTTLDITKFPPIININEQITSHDGSCFAVGNRVEGGFIDDTLWKIDASGELTSLTDVIASDYIPQLMSHQNRLYAIGSGTSANIIKRFSPNLNMIDATFGDPQSLELSAQSMRSMGENIAIKLETPAITPSQSLVTFLTSDLAEIPNTTIPSIRLPRPYQTSNLLALKIDGSDSTLLLNPFKPDPVSLLLPEVLITYIIADLDNTQLFVISKQDFGKSNLFRVQDNPSLGAIITGGWFNPSIKNQGLNIIKGTRSNGSEYINVTGYTFKDGLPFWFAGNADFQRPQNSIEIELFEFSGIAMFEADNTPERASYGSIKLQMNSCNELNSTITTADGAEFNMLLNRLDDVTNTQNCID